MIALPALLEAAPNTWNGGAGDLRTQWGCYGAAISMAKGTAIGTAGIDAQRRILSGLGRKEASR